MDFRVTILLQALNKVKDPKLDLSNEQWDQCLKFASEHGLECVFFDYYNRFFSQIFKATKIYKEWQNLVVHRIFWGRTSEVQALKMINKLIAQDIFVVVLKGIDLATYYDKPENRTMSDMDILIHPDDIDQADSIFKDFDYVHAVEDDTDKERIYYPNKDGYFFEVHYALFKKKVSAYTEKFSQIALESAVFSNKLGVHVLEPTVSTAYMISHMVKHLYGTGIGLKGLYDLAIYVNAQKNNIKKDKLIEYLEGLHMLKSGAYILACAERYLQSNFMIDFPIDEDICKNLFGIITRSGDTGMREEYLIEQRYEDLVKSRQKKVKKKMHRFAFVFLPLDQMKRRYPQLNTLPWLLPFFWGVRVIRVIFKSRQNLTKWIRRDIDHRIIITHKETISFLKEE